MRFVWPSGRERDFRAERNWKGREGAGRAGVTSFFCCFFFPEQGAPPLLSATPHRAPSPLARPRDASSPPELSAKEKRLWMAKVFEVTQNAMSQTVDDLSLERRRAGPSPTWKGSHRSTGQSRPTPISSPPTSS